MKIRCILFFSTEFDDYLYNLIRIISQNLEPKAQAPVQRRTNWKASDLGKGNTATKGADVDLS